MQRGPNTATLARAQANLARSRDGARPLTAHDDIPSWRYVVEYPNGSLSRHDTPQSAYDAAIPSGAWIWNICSDGTDVLMSAREHYIYHLAPYTDAPEDMTVDSPDCPYDAPITSPVESERARMADRRQAAKHYQNGRMRRVTPPAAPITRWHDATMIDADIARAAKRSEAIRLIRARQHRILSKA
jgi:hypothetical protein